jgi:uncharacterized protein DUF3168
VSGELAVQKAVLNVLWANSALDALLPDHSYAGSPSKPAVYEFVQQAPASEDASRFPYVVVGDTTAAEFDTDDVDGQEHTLTLHVWDRYAGRTRCRQVLDAIYNALHDQSVSVQSRHTVYCYFDGSETIPDPDVMLQHMVTRFRLVTQEQ